MVFTKQDLRRSELLQPYGYNNFELKALIWVFEFVPCLLWSDMPSDTPVYSAIDGYQLYPADFPIEGVNYKKDNWIEKVFLDMCFTPPNRYPLPEYISFRYCLQEIDKDRIDTLIRIHQL